MYYVLIMTSAIGFCRMDIELNGSEATAPVPFKVDIGGTGFAKVHTYVHMYVRSPPDEFIEKSAKM
jgi:hypothetical protein